MKKIYTIIGILSVLLTSCLTDDVLDKKNLNSIAPEEVWNDTKLATAYVNKLCMDNMPTWDASNNSFSNKSDEAANGGTFMTGELTEEDVDYWPYAGIRNINILLNDIDGGTLSAAIKDPLKGQAYFLRAFLYFELVRRYGGIPLLLVPQGINDDLMIPRNKTSEVFAQIVKDLDEAAKVLPATWTGADAGRTTAGAALALKGRVLLFYASPQYNPSNLADRWTAAYSANKAAKDYLETNKYGLFDNFKTLWFTDMNKEVILARKFMENVSVHTWEAGTRPLSESMNTAGFNQPTLEMVKAFPMKNGLPITDPASGYDSIHYWLNRDPRFYNTIAYNGCLYELSGKKGRRQWTYTTSSDESTYMTGTGFYCRKAINEANTPYQAFNSCTTPWIEIRFAEVLLNYAECAAEVDKTEEAYTALKAIRQRAGILPGPNGMYGLTTAMSKTQMVNTVLEERRIELAFEAKRHWDMRRRKLFDTQLNGTRRHRLFTVLQMANSDFLKIRDNLSLDDASYSTYFIDETRTLDTERGIDYKSNYYFYAIPTKYIKQNINLQQTLGWTGGTFDPLQ